MVRLSKNERQMHEFTDTLCGILHDQLIKSHKYIPSQVQDLVVSLLRDMLRINVQFAAQRQEYDATKYF
jgi:hypothetical protein